MCPFYLVPCLFKRMLISTVHSTIVSITPNVLSAVNPMPLIDTIQAKFPWQVTLTWLDIKASELPKHHESSMSAMLLAVALTLFLISGFNSKAEIDGKQVFAFPEGNGTKTFLVRIEYFNVNPKETNVTVPPESATSKPVQPTIGGPIQPGSDKCNLNNGMNDAIRNDFLNEHNRLRSFTAKGLAKNPLGTNGYAPKGARILKMVSEDRFLFTFFYNNSTVYDCSVEETAAIHANKCEFKHTVGGSNGENLWAIFPKQENLTGMGETASSDSTRSFL
uniref:SCP domain-containing protein n=1 Tax=Angiostrongylus cantonensis TaxID=6313 RepID=A0A158P7L1_ANGCA